MPSRRTPGRPRSAEADTAILNAALELLIERGIEATSIEQVAQRAGVTRATVYRRFPDKNQLLVAAIQQGQEAPAEMPECRDVEEMLSLWAQALGGPGARRGRLLARRLMTTLHDHPELYQAYRDAGIKHREQWIRTTLERERDRGRFPPDADLEVVRQILTGAVATHLLAYPDSSTVQEIEEFFLAVLRETSYRRHP